MSDWRPTLYVVPQSSSTRLAGQVLLRDGRHKDKTGGLAIFSPLHARHPTGRALSSYLNGWTASLSGLVLASWRSSNLLGNILSPS